MHFISQELEDYIEQHSEKEPGLLAALNKETYQKILLPRMLSGHFQGPPPSRALGTSRLVRVSHSYPQT